MRRSAAWQNGLIWLGSCCLLALVLWTSIRPLHADSTSPQASSQGTWQQLAALNKKFDGAQACQSCHGGGKDSAGTEYSLWTDKDKHAQAFDALANPDVANHPNYGKIGANLQIANVQASERCVKCHALAAPENLQGQKFTIKEGVSCNSCHGPSQDWLKPHAAKGWLDQHRQKMDHKQLLTQFGLFDTKPVAARANQCVSCHLAIDADLVTAGHPQTYFELNYFSEIEPRHWPEPDGFGHTEVWALGQIVCLREAMGQVAERADKKVSADMLKDSIAQALGHYRVVRQLIAAKAIEADGPGLDAHAAALQQAMAAPTGKEAAIGSDAKALADAAAKLVETASGFKADSNNTLKLLTAIAADADMSKDLGLRGVQQQAFAVYSLYNSYARGANVAAADSDKVNDQIAKLFNPLQATTDNPDLSSFPQDLAATKQVLPH